MTTMWDDRKPARARPHRRLRALRLLPAHLPDLRSSGARRWTPRAAASCSCDLGHEEGTSISDEIVHAPRQLPRLHGVRDRLPVGRAVRQADRGRAASRSSARSRARAWSAGTGGSIFELFPHPGRLRALAPMLVAQRRLGLTKYAAKVPKVGTLAGLAPRGHHAPGAQGAAQGHEGQGAAPRDRSASCRAASSACSSATSTRRRSTSWPRRASRSMPCASRAAAARCSSTRARTPRRWSWRRRRSRRSSRSTVVVTNAAGCGSAMKDYAHALRQEPGWAERAEAFSRKVRDISELLTEHPARAERHAVGLDRVAYHDACHLAHAQGVRAQPRALLRAIPGLEVVDPAELGDLLRLGRHLQPAQARARPRARRCASWRTCARPARR